MSASIPASAIVTINPEVIGAGGTGLDLSGLILTNSTRPPIGSVLEFTSAAGVLSYFGADTDEADLAAVYFLGFDNSNIKPAELLFAQYPAAAVNPYLRGGLIALTLPQLQSLTGTLIVTVNGIAHTSSSIDLSSATSFSNAAAIITTALNSFDASVTGSIAANTLTVTAVGSGVLAIGQALSGSGVTVGTTISNFGGSGTGGTGTYGVTPSQTASSTTIKAGPTIVTYDATAQAFVVTGGTPGVGGTITFGTGTISAGLRLRTIDGGVLSQGAAAGVPATNMAAIVATTQNFASFMTVWKPSNGDMEAFADWTNAQDDRYCYVLWDTAAALITQDDTSSALYTILQSGDAGTFPIYAPVNGANIAAFIMGAAASVDYSQLNGRTNFKFLRQSGLEPDVTDRTIADNLAANGCNYYGRWATSNDQFVFSANGVITGEFLWADSYYNQIQLNNAFQLALMSLLTSIRSVPYNAAGYALIEAAMADPIAQAVRFGSIAPGVVLSSLQIAEVRASAGLDISATLFNRGWYLQVQSPTAQIRAQRGTPVINFWYVDGESVNSINVASILIQ